MSHDVMCDVMCFLSNRIRSMCHMTLLETLDLGVNEMEVVVNSNLTLEILGLTH